AGLLLAGVAGGMRPLIARASTCGTDGSFFAPGTCSFTATGEDVFSVPAGVTMLHVVAVGAGGGGGANAGGGGGAAATVTADISVPSGLHSLYVEVGGPGSSASSASGGAPGTNGGGAGGADASASPYG